MKSSATRPDPVVLIAFKQFGFDEAAFINTASRQLRGVTASPAGGASSGTQRETIPKTLYQASRRASDAHSHSGSSTCESTVTRVSTSPNASIGASSNASSAASIGVRSNASSAASIGVRSNASSAASIGVGSNASNNASISTHAGMPSESGFETGQALDRMSLPPVRSVSLSESGVEDTRVRDLHPVHDNDPDSGLECSEGAPSMNGLPLLPNRQDQPPVHTAGAPLAGMMFSEDILDLTGNHAAAGIANIKAMTDLLESNGNGHLNRGLYAKMPDGSLAPMIIQRAGTIGIKMILIYEPGTGSSRVSRGDVADLLRRAFTHGSNHKFRIHSDMTSIPKQKGESVFQCHERLVYKMIDGSDAGKKLRHTLLRTVTPDEVEGGEARKKRMPFFRLSPFHNAGSYDVSRPAGASRVTTGFIDLAAA